MRQQDTRAFEAQITGYYANEDGVRIFKTAKLTWVYATILEMMLEPLVGNITKHPLSKYESLCLCTGFEGQFLILIREELDALLHS